MPKRASKRRGKSNVQQKISIDSRVWRLPVHPPEVSFSVLPFTIAGNVKVFGLDKANNYTLTYTGIIAGVRDTLSLSTGSFAVRVTHYGAYGKTSTEETTTQNASQALLSWYDAYTGRIVRGSSSYAERVRVGVEQSHLRQWKWVNSGSRETVQENYIGQLRKTGGNICLDDDNEQSSYYVVVRGFIRFTDTPKSC